MVVVFLGSQNHSDIRHQHPHPPSPPPSPRPHPRPFRGLDDLHHPPHPPKDQPPHPQLQDSHFLPYQQTKEVLIEPHLDLYYGQNITVEVKFYKREIIFDFNPPLPNLHTMYYFKKAGTITVFYRKNYMWQLGTITQIYKGSNNLLSCAPVEHEGSKH